MPKDYARYVNKSKRPLPEQGWRKRLLWVTCLLLVVGIVIYGANLYQQQKTDDDSQAIGLWVKQLKSLFAKAPKKEDALAVASSNDAAKEDKPEADIQFSFYSNLSNMQVPVPQTPAPLVVPPAAPAISTPVAVQAQNIPIPESKPMIAPVPSSIAPVRVMADKYLLQIAAFRNPTAAGEMRISLLLAGFEVEIVKAISNNQQIYQLQQGPYQSIAQAKSMQRVLKNKGIESVIVKKIE